MRTKKNRYVKLIEKIFELYYTGNTADVFFQREDFIRIAKEFGIDLPKNLGDIIYSFRYRTDLPDSIRMRAPIGSEWIIRPVGQGRYKFCLVSKSRIVPSTLLAETKIPDATPGIIAKYTLDDEQSLLAKLRYNRLIDIFTGVACYSLQSHLRTTVKGIGQIETDELYVGVDQRGAQYVFPVQAKGGKDQVGLVQIEQDFAMCATKFPTLICKPIAAQFMENNLIALFSFEQSSNKVAIASERHYRLVPPEQMTVEDLQNYRQRSS